MRKVHRMSTMLQGKTFILFKFPTTKLKMRAKSGMNIFDSEIIFFGLDSEEITSYGRKQFGGTNNRLCKLSTA